MCHKEGRRLCTPLAVLYRGVLEVLSHYSVRLCHEGTMTQRDEGRLADDGRQKRTRLPDGTDPTRPIGVCCWMAIDECIISTHPRGTFMPRGWVYNGGCASFKAGLLIFLGFKHIVSKDMHVCQCRESGCMQFYFIFVSLMHFVMSLPPGLLHVHCLKPVCFSREAVWCAWVELTSRSATIKHTGVYGESQCYKRLEKLVVYVQSKMATMQQKKRRQMVTCLLSAFALHASST